MTATTAPAPALAFCQDCGNSTDDLATCAFCATVGCECTVREVGHDGDTLCTTCSPHGCPCDECDGDAYDRAYDR